MAAKAVGPSRMRGLVSTEAAPVLRGRARRREGLDVGSPKALNPCARLARLSRGARCRSGHFEPQPLLPEHEFLSFGPAPSVLQPPWPLQAFCPLHAFLSLLQPP
jgi:hypothetical protein